MLLLRFCAGHYLKDLRRDSGLARLIIDQGEILNQFVRIIGRVLHRHHLRGELAGNRFQQCLIDQRIHVARQQSLVDLGRAWLVDVVDLCVFAFVLFRLLDWQKLHHGWLLRHRIHKLGIHHVDDIGLLFQEDVDGDLRDGRGIVN